MSDKIRVPDLIRMRKRNEKIVSLTAYDYTFARLVDDAGAHVILVGDSLGSVVQGGENTLPVTLDEMVYHTRIVSRGVSKALLVADMPFMSYQTGARDALVAAGRLVKEGSAAAVKLEGGTGIAETVSSIVEAGIPVMGHVGLTPQSFHRMGGHRVQGRKNSDAKRILADAKAIEAAGAFSIVLEGIPAELAKSITDEVSIPTIGIGAGPDCSGQILVLYDMLGLSSFGGYSEPRFVKKYAELAKNVQGAVEAYALEIKEGTFPAPEHCYAASSPRLVKSKATGS